MSSTRFSRLSVSPHFNFILEYSLLFTCSTFSLLLLLLILPLPPCSRRFVAWYFCSPFTDLTRRSQVKRFCLSLPYSTKSMSSFPSVLPRPSTENRPKLFSQRTHPFLTLVSILRFWTDLLLVPHPFEPSFWSEGLWTHYSTGPGDIFIGGRTSSHPKHQESERGDNFHTRSGNVLLRNLP